MLFQCKNFERHNTQKHSFVDGSYDLIIKLIELCKDNVIFPEVCYEDHPPS